MISYFPAAFDDELLASVVARYHRNRFVSVIGTENEKLYGQRHQRTSVSMPTNIAGLQANVGAYLQMTSSEMIDKLTFFPYDYAHVSSVVRKKAKKKMLVAATGRGSAVARFVKRPIGMKVCLDCMHAIVVPEFETVV